MANTKPCTICSKEHAIESYQKHAMSKDGRLSTCKSCRKIKVQEWRSNNPLKYREQLERARTKRGTKERSIFSVYN